MNSIGNVHHCQRSEIIILTNAQNLFAPVHTHCHASSPMPASATHNTITTCCKLAPMDVAPMDECHATEITLMPVTPMDVVPLESLQCKVALMDVTPMDVVPLESFQCKLLQWMLLQWMLCHGNYFNESCSNGCDSTPVEFKTL